MSQFSGPQRKGAMKERNEQKRYLAENKHECWVCQWPLTRESTIWQLPAYRKGSPQTPVAMHIDCRGEQKLITEKVLVPNAWDMNRETFRKHFEKRHADSMGGLKSLLPAFDDEMYGSFHDRLHTVRIDLDHEHKEAR